MYSSKAEINVCYGLSSLGKVVRVEIDPGYLKTIAPTCGIVDAHIDKAIYCRDFESVQRSLMSYRFAGNKDDQALESLTERCFPKEVPIDWNFAKNQDRSLFENDLKQRSTSIPSTLAKSSLISRDFDLKQALDLIKMNLKARTTLAEGDCDSITRLVEEMERSTLNVSEFVTSEHILELARGTTSLNSKQLDLAIKLLSTMPQRLDTKACMAVYMMLYPTVYDSFLGDFVSLPAASGSISGSPKSEIIPRASKEMSAIMSPPIPESQPNIETGNSIITQHVHYMEVLPADLKRILCNTKTSINLLTLHREFKSLKNQQEKETFAFRKYKEKQHHVIVSADFQWALLSSLLGRGMLSEYFDHGYWLMQTFPASRSLVAAVKTHNDTVGLGKLKYSFGQAIDSVRPTLLLGCLKEMCKIIQSSLDHLQPFSSVFDSFLVDRCKRLTRILKLAECSHFPGYKELCQQLAALNLRDKKLKSMISPDLCKELSILQAKVQ